MIDFAAKLSEIQSEGNLRRLPEVEHCGGNVLVDGRKLLNFSSNDYLAIHSDSSLQDRFFAECDCLQLGSTSSRLLSGNYSSHRKLESTLAELFGRSALTFSTGYQMNSGILPAVCSSRTLIIADKLVHASIIDGLKLVEGKFMRFAHQNFKQLRDLIEKYHGEYSEIIIVVESIYSMDGDVCNLAELVEIKNHYDNVMLYVDEAHAVGVRGARGLGVAEEQGVIGDIDFLCGTFGKAIGSVGAYVICSEVIKEYLINKMRTLIFTTALPPINAEWTRWVLEHLEEMTDRRNKLNAVSEQLRNGLVAKGLEMPSESHIVPVMVGESEAAVALSLKLQGEGIYVLAVRPPTVPRGTSRLRLSLTASVTTDNIQQLLANL